MKWKTRRNSHWIRGFADWNFALKCEFTHVQEYVQNKLLLTRKYIFRSVRVLYQKNLGDHKTFSELYFIEPLSTDLMILVNFYELTFSNNSFKIWVCVTFLKWQLVMMSLFRIRKRWRCLFFVYENRNVQLKKCVFLLNVRNFPFSYSGLASNDLKKRRQRGVLLIIQPIIQFSLRFLFSPLFATSISSMIRSVIVAVFSGNINNFSLEYNFGLNGCNEHLFNFMEEKKCAFLCDGVWTIYIWLL